MFDSLKSELQSKGSVIFTVRARPGMAQTQAVSLMDDESVKIDLAAPPEGGKANVELIRFLAEEFGVKKGQIAILSGAAARVKLVRVIS